MRGKGGADEREKEGQMRGKGNDGYQSSGSLDQGLSNTHLAMFSI